VIVDTVIKLFKLFQIEDAGAPSLHENAGKTAKEIGKSTPLCAVSRRFCVSGVFSLLGEAASTRQT